MKKILTFIYILTLSVGIMTFQANAAQCYNGYGCFPTPVAGSGYYGYYLGIMQNMINAVAASDAQTFTGTIDYADTPGHILTGYFVNGTLAFFQCVNGVPFYFEYDTEACAKTPGLKAEGSKCVCANNADIKTLCGQCTTGNTMVDGTCYTSCTKTNVCGQNLKGGIINGSCTLQNHVSDADMNNSCISSFNISADNVNPNGSVEFSWTLITPPANVGRKCGFVDLTTPTPRPIPGLQNLDPNLDRTRISNVQSTTRFCLVCQFYSLLDNSVLGTAQQHQWIRVLRVGEN